MGLKETIESAVNSAFAAVESLAYQIEYHRIMSRQYDPATDTYINQVEEVYPAILAIPTKERKDEDDYQLVNDDSMKVIISSKQLGFEPTTHDYLILAGNHYEILKSVYVPGRGIYTLTIRNP